MDRTALPSPSHLRFSARADSSPHPLWFYFCIEGARVPAVRCDLMNADQCPGPRTAWHAARPVFSPDGRHWQRVARAGYVEDSLSTGYFSFTVPIVGPRTYVAYCYPYTTGDLDRLLASFPDRPELWKGELTRSAEGRPVPYVRIGSLQAGKSAVWVMARQHAGETPASYTLEGLLRFLAGPDPLAREALARACFHAVPMLDVDGVYHGRYGKDELPVDCNRDWGEEPRRREIAAVVQRIRDAGRREVVCLVLDLHASRHGDSSCFLFGSAAVPPAQSHAAFLRLVSEEAPPEIGFRESDLRIELPPSGSARAYLSQLLKRPVLTVEMSYGQAQSGRYLTPDHYLEFGKSLGRSLSRYLQSGAGTPPG